MSVQGSIGTTLRVAVGAPATYDLAGIDTLQATATLVGEISSYGEYGGSGTVETHTPVDTGVVNKAIGVIDYGQLSLSIGKDATDDGQIMLKAGFDGDKARQRHTFIVTFPDGTREAFTGKISSFTTNPGSAGPFVAGTCNIELDNQVLALAAID